MARIILNSMKKIVLAFCLIGGFIFSEAQTNNKEVFSLTNVHHYVGPSVVELADPYLSILNYTGYGMRLEYTDVRYFNPHNPVLSSYSRIAGLAALTVNPQSTASVTYIGGNVAWGMLYEYRDFSNFVLLAGANVDFDFAYKMNSRNVNNPFNMDLATDLNAMLGVRYIYPTRKRTLKFSASIEFPLVGCMFVPYPGLSYYEMYSSKAYGEAIHFSSLHNKQGMKQQISIDVPFKYSSWSFGARMHQLTYQVGELPYSFNEFSLFVGITYDLIRFSGRKVAVPESFISPGY